jgi:hypothetical protein
MFPACFLNNRELIYLSFIHLFRVKLIFDEQKSIISLEKGVLGSKGYSGLENDTPQGIQHLLVPLI